MVVQIISRDPRPCGMFLNKDGFCNVRLASRQTLKLDDQANLHIRRPTSPYATRGDAHAVVTETYGYIIIIIIFII